MNGRSLRFELTRLLCTLVQAECDSLFGIDTNIPVSASHTIDRGAAEGLKIALFENWQEALPPSQIRHIPTMFR